jgi:hypothetical protein
VTGHNGLRRVRGIVWVGVLCAFACGGPSTSGQDEDVLIRVGSRRITPREFQQAFELTKTAHPDSVDPSSVSLADARSRLLEELATELVLRAHADAVGMAVSDSELDDAVAAIRSDYPPGVFEQTLADAAVPFEGWKQRVRLRLLMDKLIARELRPLTALTLEETAAYYDEHYRGKALRADSGERFQRLQQTIVADLGQRKLEQAFDTWVDGLKQTYPVEVNHAVWARMIDSAPASAGK